MYSFPRLRQRLFDLQTRAAHNSSFITQYRDTTDPERLALLAQIHHEYEALLPEIEEIQFVLAHFQALQSKWPTRYQITFGLFVLIALALALLSLWKAF